MNKTSHYLKTIVLSLVAVLAMASCTDDDTQQAYDLDGYWQGSIMGNYYADRFHSSDNWDTEIWFVQDGDLSSGGYGRERDYNMLTGYAYEVDFLWEVHNGRIYIDYDDGYSVVIRDYELYYVGSGQRFRGYFDDPWTGETLASFNLVKIGGWSDWAKPHTMKLDSIRGKAAADSAAMAMPAAR